jgi:RNA polymerase sigma-70 factor (ECF subfamily)
MAPPPDTVDLAGLLRHSEWLRALARSLVADGDAADDLVQDAWLAAARRPPDPARPARPWLAGVVRRLALFRARTEGRRRRREERAARPESLPSTEEVYERIDTERRLREAVLALDEPYRRTVVERYYHGLSAAEIASREGVPAATVRSRLRRALEELRARLGGEDARSGGSWRHALLALAEAPLSAPVAQAAVAGGMAMSVKLGLSVAFAGVLALVGRELLRGGSPPSVETGPTRTAETKVAQNTTTQSGSLDRSGYLGERRPLADRPTRIEVKDVDGAPVTGAKLVVFRGDEVLRSDETGETGGIEVSGEDGEAEVVVLAEGFSFRRAQVDLDQERCEITVGEGARLDGTLVVDGGPPKEPMELSLYSDRSFFDVEGVPRSVWESLGIAEGGPTALQVLVGEGGRFSVAGVQEDWSGKLNLPKGYAFADRVSPRSYPSLETSVRLEAPRTGLRFEVHKYEAVVGRIVEPGSERGVAGATLTASIRGPWGDRLFGARADEGGRFRVPLDEDAFEALSVEFSAPDGRGRRSVSFETAGRLGPWEVGDLELAVVRDRIFEAKDLAGAPIAGAAALAVDGSAGTCERTDSHGRGLLREVSPEVTRVRVAALGFTSVEAAVPADPTAPVGVRLAPANRLDVLLRSPSGEVPADLKVAIEAEAAFFGGESRYPDRAHVAAGAARSTHGSRFGPRGGTLVFDTTQPGRWVFCDLRADVSLMLQVQDRYGTVLHREAVPPLAASEQRALEVWVDPQPRVFAGRVLDTEGRPVVGASVLLKVAEGRGDGAPTDGEGRFRFEGFHASEVDVRVEKPGFVASTFERHPVPADGSEVEFRLSEGRSVRVRVEDERGRPVSAQVGVAGVDGAGARPILVEKGVYECSNLPEAEVELLVQVGGRTYRQVHPATLSEARVVVPVHGEVEVEVRAPVDLSEEGQEYVILRPWEGSGEEELKAPVETDAGLARARFEAVLPGRYRALVRAWRRTGPGSEHGWVDLSGVVPVTVRAAEVSRVTIEE